MTRPSKHLPITTQTATCTSHYHSVLHGEELTNGRRPTSNDPLVQYEYHEIRNAIDFDRTVAANVGWKALVATPGNRKRMRIIIALAFFSQWSGNGLVSYYLNRVFDSIGITDPTIQASPLDFSY